MYPWKYLRLLIAATLLLPALHFAYAVTQDLRQVTTPGPTTWSADVEAMIRKDLSNPLPEQRTAVVIGGRQVTLWDLWQQESSNEPITLRGLGDAAVDDLYYYREALYRQIKPKVLVLLPSDSEFHLRNVQPAPRFADQVMELAEDHLAQHPDNHFYVLAPIKPPRYRAEAWRSIDRAVDYLHKMAEEQARVVVLDSNAALINERGETDPNAFGPHGIYLNHRGLTRLSALVQRQLSVDAPELL